MGQEAQGIEKSPAGEEKIHTTWGENNVHREYLHAVGDRKSVNLYAFEEQNIAEDISISIAVYLLGRGGGG